MDYGGIEANSLENSHRAIFKHSENFGNANEFSYKLIGFLQRILVKFAHRFMI